LIVDTKDNRSLTLIKNLPFNTMDYTDVTIVLKQILYKIHGKKYIIKNIVFKYYFENKLKPDSILKRLLSTPYETHTQGDCKKLAGIYSMLSLNERPEYGGTPRPPEIDKKRLFMAIIFMLGLFLILVTMIILYLEISLFKSECLNADIFKPCTFENYETLSFDEAIASKEIPCNEFIRKKWSIFDPIIKLFNLCEGEKYNSFPNTFLASYPYNSFGGKSVETGSFCLGEYIVYHEFYKVFALQDYIRVVSEFSEIINIIHSNAQGQIPILV